MIFCFMKKNHKILHKPNFNVNVAVFFKSIYRKEKRENIVIIDIFAVIDIGKKKGKYCYNKHLCSYRYIEKKKGKYCYYKHLCSNRYIEKKKRKILLL